MNVLIVGANGQIGKQLVHILNKESAYSVRALIRSEDQSDAFKRQGVEPVLGNLEGTVDELTEVAKDSDAIVFTAGSGGHTGFDQTLLVDLDGAVKMIEAAEKAGVQRFIMVSAIQAHNRDNWNEKIKPYFVAKHYADRILMQSKLTYTIIRPGGLTNEPGTGHVKIAENLERDFISREDVARTIAATLQEERTCNQAFDLVSGPTPIAEALKQI